MGKVPIKRKDNAQKHGRLCEPKLAKRLGGRTMKGSGSVDGHKGDVDLPEYRMESKSTVKESLSLKLSWLRKIEGEARPLGKYPAVAIQFVNGRGDPVPDGKWVAVPEDVFKRLHETV